MQFRRNQGVLHRTPNRGKRHPHRASSRLTQLLLLALAIAANPAWAATLHYDAFLSGLHIGSAVVNIHLDQDGYRIAGTASSSGVAHIFSDWRSDFLAAGAMQGSSPVLTAYAYDEREKKKHRVLWLADGVVRTVKNDQVRSAHSVHGGTDILTAFFLQGECWSDRQLHTGRYSYRITGRQSSDPDSCHFEVRQPDGDRSRFHVRFADHEGRRIPVEVRTKGILRGRVKLRAMNGAPADDEDAVLLAERQQ